ncbi:methyl-accepting chemotaxis protein [Nitratidesulfovibrio sp.]|uniref:HAMP domain-containing methyl-accepting chemotaxis protein n=1 Tax=Nitratidesulfovibrio sp. TaxID=2802297 RepID=UPI0033408344
MKLSVKLSSAFGIVILLVVVMGGYGNIMFGQVLRDMVDITSNWMPSVKELGNIRALFNEIRRAELLHIATDDAGQMAEVEKLLNKSRTDFYESLARYEKLISSPEEKALYAKFTPTVGEYRDLLARSLALSREQKKGDAREITVVKSRPVFNEAMASLMALVAYNDQGSQVSGNSAEREAGHARSVNLALMAISLLLGIGCAAYIIRSTLSQLGEDPGYLYALSNEIAAGNLGVTFRPSKYTGVYVAMQHMVDTLKAKIAEAEDKSAMAARKEQEALVAMHEADEARKQAERAKAEGMMQAARQLEGVVEIISSASEELSAQIEQSSRGAEQQAQRVGETATAMEEMNATVLEVARNATQAAETSEKARQEAQDGAGVVNSVVKGIGEVRQQSMALKDDMAALGRQAEGIGQVMGVISDIADQTNLLALNAAIEAARAGEAGRGFAVVADEVRKLAEKTMTATKEVGEAINGIQGGTRKNMDNVDRSARTIEEATTLAERSGAALHRIVQLVQQASDQVRSIATASEQQSAASEEISRSVEHVATISSETSQAMGQASQAMSELARQSQVLQTLIADMKSDGN